MGGIGKSQILPHRHDIRCCVDELQMAEMGQMPTNKRLPSLRVPKLPVASGGGGGGGG